MVKKNVIKELKKKIAFWKKEGYDVKKIEGLAKKMLWDELEREVTKFEIMIKRLKWLEEALNSLNTKCYSSEVEKIRAKMKDVYKLPEIEAEIIKLTADVKYKEEKEYLGEFGRIREIESEIEKLDTSGLEPLVEQIRSKIEMGLSLNEVEALFDELKLKVSKREEERKKLSKLKEKIEEWKNEGYIISKLEKLFDNLEELEKEMQIFKLRVDKLRELKDELDQIDASRTEKENIYLLMKDVENIPLIEDEILILRQEIEELGKLRKRRREIEEELEKLRKEGFKIEKMKKTLYETEKIEEPYAIFREKIERARELKKKLDSIPYLSDEKNKLAEMLRDIDDIDIAEEKISQFLTKRKDMEDRLKEIEKKIEEWRIEGYEIPTDLLSGSVEEVEKKYQSFSKGVEKLKEIGVIIRSIDTSEVKESVKEIEELLNKPEFAEKAESLMKELQIKIGRIEEHRGEKIEKEKMMRNEYINRMKNWEEAGYNISRLKKIIDMDIETIKKEFIVFEIKVRRLKELEEELNSINKTGFEREYKEIIGKMKDVDKIPEISTKILELEIKSKSKKVK
ncbi:MAG: hypothetical protein AB1779_00600 [Candidatus Thermoplasmatota archaeon]